MYVYVTHTFHAKREQSRLPEGPFGSALLSDPDLSPRAPEKKKINNKLSVISLVKKYFSKNQ